MREEPIFYQLLEQPADQREAYLAAACGDDAELRDRVKALLRADANPGSFLQSPAVGVLATIDNPPSERPGALIGRYKLLEQVGEGGMGVVYVAEQTEPVRRRVALKIIKPGMDTKQVIARFEAERQALAMMDHPNIARVLDAGTTEAGRPYFVMELVRGMPVTEYCDKARLSPRQRLELFVEVCQAVQHAHQKGIIHRDLKPSNVMITMQDGRPVVKVIDFGVAKAVGQQLTERTVYTALTQLVGTPLYMSPEQAELTSHDVDTRSDIYSLGVLLYELLTGQTPFDKEALSKAGFDEMRRMIREDEPLRPSHRVSTLGAAAISTASQHRGLDERRLSKILCGELDWIVMKALEKDRSRRYESASALAADIQRYLSDEPVLACPPTTMYRFQKFARKHKPALVTAAAIALCLLLGTTVSAWQAIRATAAEVQAAANEAQAKFSAKKADEKAQEATKERDEAQKQRDEVKALNESLHATQAELRGTLYAAEMNLAHNAWGQGDIRAMQTLLSKNIPKAGEPDLRGFEWHYLHRLRNPQLLTLPRHSQPVSSIAYSPDGKRLATACWDKTVRVFDGSDGKLLLLLKDGSNRVAFSPDGNRLASGSTVWDANTGEKLLQLKGTEHIMAFSPDGKRLAGVLPVSERRGMRIWDAHTGEEVLSLEGAAYRNNRDIGRVFTFSPDGGRVVANVGPSVKIWDAHTGEERLSIRSPTHTIHSPTHSTVFSPDGKRLAGIFANRLKTWENELKVWDAQTGNELLTLKGHQGMGSFAFSPDGLRLATGSGEPWQLIKIWDARTGRELFTIKGQDHSIYSLAFSPDSKRLASASRDGTVKVWDATANRSEVIAKGGSDSVWRAVFSPDGKRIASAADNKTIKIWEAQTGPNVDTGKDLLVLKGHTGAVQSVAFSPDGKRLASGSLDNTVKLWDATNGEEIRTLNGHSDAVYTVVFSPDGQRVASASGDKTIKVWNISTGEAALTLEGRPKPTLPWVTLGLAFSPDGNRVAGGSGNKLKIWNTNTGRELLAKNVSDWQGGISLAFSPDGKYLARAGGDSEILDSQTGQQIRRFVGQGAARYGIAFSPDGKRLASVASDGTAKIWNSLTGQETLTLRGHKDRVINVAFSPDGNRLATNGLDGTVRIWDATPLPEKP